MSSVPKHLLSVVESDVTQRETCLATVAGFPTSRLKVDQGTRMLNQPHLCVLFAVQSEAADGVAVFDGRGPPGALQTETH